MRRIVKAKEDLTGRRFGRLVVIKQVEDKIYSNNDHCCNWLCKCDCGNYVTVVHYSLTKDKFTKSCGCFKKEVISQVSSNYHSKHNIYEWYEDYGICYTEDRKHHWIFDVEDYDKIKGYYWTVLNQNSKYASAKDKKRNTTVQMSRIIMNADSTDKKIYVDHINHDVSDNRKSNLRICTNSQNNMNKGPSVNNKSGVTGVIWRKDKHKWEAQIGVNHKTLHLGLFDEFNDAVKARKTAEVKYFGEYSYDNSMKKVGETNVNLP